VFVLPLALRPLSLARENPLLDYARALVRDSKPGDLIVLGSDDANFAALDLELVRGESGGRVFLSPTLFALPQYVRGLARRYPGLVVPPAGPDGLPIDWTLWMRLNPGRAVLLEPSLLDTALRTYPHSVPQGSLVRLETRPVEDDAAEDALRFLDEPETSSVTRWSIRPWTQEIYVTAARRKMAAWLYARLDPRNDRGAGVRLARLMMTL
jgi:hypothetical protein